MPPPRTKILTWRANVMTAAVRCKSSTSKNNEATATMGKKCYTIMTKERGMLVSISSLCGHTASILTVSAYLMTDILALRSLAIFSGAFVSLFQYFRPQPLWMPLKWNAVLMTINVCMVSNLLMERNAAENMPSDKKRLYDDGKFDQRGFSKVQFKKFIENGRLRVVRTEEMICQENREMDKLYYIIDGNATARCSKDGRKLGTITPHKFVGEMAFLEYYQNLKADEGAPHARASANVVADDMLRVWEWDARGLARVFEDDRDLSNAFMTYCSHDLRTKLISSNEEGRANPLADAKVKD